MGLVHLSTAPIDSPPQLICWAGLGWAGLGFAGLALAARLQALLAFKRRRLVDATRWSLTFLNIYQISLFMF